MSTLELAYLQWMNVAQERRLEIERLRAELASVTAERDALRVAVSEIKDLPETMFCGDPDTGLMTYEVHEICSRALKNGMSTEAAGPTIK